MSNNKKVSKFRKEIKQKEKELLEIINSEANSILAKREAAGFLNGIRYTLTLVNLIGNPKQRSK